MTLHLELPENLKRLEKQAAAEKGASVNKYIESLIVEDQKARAKADLEAKQLEGINSGPATPMTSDDWEDLRRTVKNEHAKQARR